MCCQEVEEFGGDNVSDVTVWGSALDLNQTIELIDDNLPMIGRLSWSLTSGHLVVISGYDMQEQARMTIVFLYIDNRGDKDEKTFIHGRIDFMPDHFLCI